MLYYSKMTGIHVFDSPVQKANFWIKGLMEELQWSDEDKTHIALRAVLWALRDRMTIEETAHLAAELPLVIRGMFYESWNPHGKPLKMHREEFLGYIKGQFINEIIEPKEIIRAVFRLLKNKISAGEIKDVRNIIPKDLQDFWD